MLKDMDFYHLQKNIKKCWIQGLDSLKNVVHNTSQILRSKIADAVTDLYDEKIEKTKPVEEIIISREGKKKGCSIKQIKSGILKNGTL